MPIRFQCHQCGARLKAPDNGVGRATKCLKCGTLLIVPEPVYEAEVVSEAPYVLEVRDDAPYVLSPEETFDLQQDSAYDLPPAPAPAEQRRPCPACGEMIIATAVKCRFCGEVFDPVLRKGKEKKKRRKSSGDGSSATGGRDIGIGLLCIAIGLGITIASFANPTPDGKGGGRFYVFYGLIIGGFVQLCRGIGALLRSD
jgi:predicted RNA-binding Zn-ribbon protein involved in translation (DUF1610 family)